MRTRKRLLLQIALPILCVGCGKTSATSPKASDLAAPVLAPLAARDHLLHEIDGRKAAGRARGNQLRAVIDRGN